MRERANDVKVTPGDARRARDRSVRADDLADADTDGGDAFASCETLAECDAGVKNRLGSSCGGRREALRAPDGAGDRIAERNGDLGRTDVDPDAARHQRQWGATPQAA